MIKQNLKMFFKNIAYVFVPMGIIYLFLILILFTFAQFFLNKTASTINSIGTLIDQTISFNQTELTDYMKNAFGQINFENDFGTVLKEVFDTEWITKTINGFLKIITDSSTEFTDEVNKQINDYALALQNRLIYSLVCFALSAYLAVFVTRFILRKTNYKRSIFKAILASIINATLIAFILSITTYLVALWKFSLIFSSLIHVIVISYTSLLLSWLVLGYKKISFKEVVNFKNTFYQILSEIIMMAIAIVFVGLVNVIFNSLLAFLVALPILIYIASLIGIIFDSYVYSLVIKNFKRIRTLKTTEQLSEEMEEFHPIDDLKKN